MIYVAYKNAFFRKMQFWSHCYTVVSYPALFRLSVYKIPAVYLSGAKNVCFCTIRDFGSPTTCNLEEMLVRENIDNNVLCIQEAQDVACENSVPSKIVTIRPGEPPWITCHTKTSSEK